MSDKVILYLVKLSAQCNTLINLANTIRFTRTDDIDAHLKNLEKIGTALADTRRTLLYFKNTGYPTTPPGPPTKPKDPA